ncbi:MAG: WG repeat-containing protein [Bacteroidota bacterium]
MANDHEGFDSLKPVLVLSNEQNWFPFTQGTFSIFALLDQTIGLSSVFVSKALPVIMIYRLIVVFLCVFNVVSCQEDIPIHPDNYKIVGRPAAWGLQDAAGNLVLDTVYLFLNFRNEIDGEPYYLTYKTHDGRSGMYLTGLDQPYFEVGDGIAYFGVINSLDYFSVGGPAKDRFGNYLEGVMDREGNIIVPVEYKNILHYGGKLFFASHPQDKLYSILNTNGELIPNRGRYTWVYGKYGVLYAQKERATDIWGANGCLLDDDGKEITESIYKNIAVLKSPFHEQKMYLSMRKEGQQSLYYPDGQRIYEENVGVSPIGMVADLLVMRSENHDRVDRNIVGKLRKDGIAYYLTYEGELLEVKAYQASIGL